MYWIPRTIRQKQKKIEIAIKEIEYETGRSEEYMSELQSNSKHPDAVSCLYKTIE